MAALAIETKLQVDFGGCVTAVRRCVVSTLYHATPRNNTTHWTGVYEVWIWKAFQNGRRVPLRVLLLLLLLLILVLLFVLALILVLVRVLILVLVLGVGIGRVEDGGVRCAAASPADARYGDAA